MAYPVHQLQANRTHANTERSVMPSAKELLEISTQLPVDQSLLDIVIEALTRNPPEHDRARHTIMLSPILALHVLREGSEISNGRIPLSIETACSVLGREQLRDLCERIPATVGSSDDERSFTRHSVEVASLSQGLAGTFCSTLENEAYLAGLLHDIGRALLISLDQEMANDVGETLSHDAGLIGPAHVTAGAILARRLNLPIPVARAIESHHEDGPPAVMLSKCVWMAEVITAGSRSRHERTRALAAGEHLGLALGDLRLMMLVGSYGQSIGRAPRLRLASGNPLSPRQRQVVQLLTAGYRPAQIAQSLTISVSTVNNTLSQIYRKLGVTSNVQAVLMCDRQGWL